VIDARLVAPLLSVNGELGMSSARHLRAAPSDSGSSALCLRTFMFDPCGVSECLGDLTCRERELVEAVNAGHVLECSQLSTEQLSATGDPKHIIRAELLRELLLTRCDKPLDPRGVRVRGARITGVLDLTHVQTAVGIELRSCSFDHLARGARVGVGRHVSPPRVGTLHARVPTGSGTDAARRQGRGDGMSCG
jgi:hypothetical protein